jgi:hypothetical protein
VSKINGMIRANRRFEKYVMLWRFHLAQCSSYWRNIWTRDEWVRNLFHAFCHKNRKTFACRYRWSCLIVRIQIQVSYEVWSLEANLGYTVTILKRKYRVLTGNQIKSIQIKCESHVGRFLRYWRNCSS